MKKIIFHNSIGSKFLLTASGDLLSIGLNLSANYHVHLKKQQIFAVFIEALYRDAMEHPENLLKTEDIWSKRALKLIEGVDADDQDILEFCSKP